MNKASDPVGIMTAVCTHIPHEPFKHVGQVTFCNLCGKPLAYSNNPPGSRTRMSKKQRRALKQGAVK